MEEEEEISVDQRNFEEAVDKLLESNRKPKMTALNQIHIILQDKFQLVDYDANRETFCEGLRKCLSSSNESERTLACKALSVYALLLGTDCSLIIPTFSPILNQLVARDSGPTFTSAINALSILLFVGGEQKETLQFLDKLATFFKKQNLNDQDLYKVLNCWSFLLTVVPNSLVATEILPMELDHLVEIFKSNRSHEIAIVAGYAVALLIQIYKTYEQEHNHNDNFDIYDLEGYTSISDMLETIDLLSRERDRSINTQNQKSLKKSFRQISASLRDGSAPSEDLKLVDTVIEFKTWPEIIQLNFFRDLLKNGLYCHMRYNELFSEIFDYNIALDSQISAGIKDSEKSRIRKEKQKFVSKKLHKLSSTNLQARNDNAAYQ